MVVEATGTSVTWKEAHLSLRSGAIYKKNLVGVGPNLTRRPSFGPSFGPSLSKQTIKPSPPKKSTPARKPRLTIKPSNKEIDDDFVLMNRPTKSTGVSSEPTAMVPVIKKMKLRPGANSRVPASKKTKKNTLGDNYKVPGVKIGKILPIPNYKIKRYDKNDAKDIKKSRKHIYTFHQF